MSVPGPQFLHARNGALGLGGVYAPPDLTSSLMLRFRTDKKAPSQRKGAPIGAFSPCAGWGRIIGGQGCSWPLFLFDTSRFQDVDIFVDFSGSESDVNTRNYPQFPPVIREIKM